MNEISGTTIPDPVRVPIEEIPSLIMHLAALQSALAARLMQDRENDAGASEDRLLTIDEAAERLRTSKDWLYRNSSRLPFTRRIGRTIRFSERSLQLFIEHPAVAEAEPGNNKHSVAH